MSIRGRMKHLRDRATLAWKLKARPFIVSAGMPRSGSTLLFNMLREIMETRWGGDLRSCWQAELPRVAPGRAYLVKTHLLYRFYRWRANRSFYSYRDIRTAAVSRIRKKGQALDIRFFRRHIAQYELAKRHCDLSLSYEELTESKHATIERLAKSLGIAVKPDEILSRVDQLQPPQNGTPVDKHSLLHSDHFTHTGSEEWRDALPPGLQKEVHKEFAWWFEECGYPTE